MTTTTTTLSELPDLKGSELGTSDWIEVTQDRVTSSPTPPTTTSGSMSTPNARRPRAPSAGRSRTAT